MLNKKIKKTAIFFYIFSSVISSFAGPNLWVNDSTEIEKLTHIFKVSNQKKYLHAVVLNEILVKGNAQSSIDDELMYLYVQELLNNDLNQEAFTVLALIKETVNSCNLQQYWKYNYWMGIAFRFDNNFDTAHFYFDRAIQIGKKINDFSALGNIYYSKGKTFQRQGNRDKALPYYLKANNLITDDIYALSQSKRRISSTYSLRKEHTLALKYINEALDLYVRANLNDLTNDSILDFGEYANLLQSRAYVYRETAKNTADSLQYLSSSLWDAKTSIILKEKQNRGQVFESDIMYSNMAYKYFYSRTIEAIARLYNATGDKLLLNDALQYAEMDKSSALLRTVQKEIALNRSQIPDSTKRYLKKRYLRLSEVEAKRFEENAIVRVNDTALYDLNIELYDLVSEITSLEKTLELDYPLYAELKYKVTPPNLDFILEESYDKAILEYVVSNEKLYAFLIVDGNIHFNHFYFRDDFIESVEHLQQMISDIATIDFSLKEINEFEILSHQLYVDLIKPFEAYIGDKQLLIVPDEQLSLIPFEVLLTAPSVSKSINYNELPYLVKKHDISYAYSLTLSHKQKNILNDADDEQLLAMAPTYDKLAGNQGSQYIALRGSFRDARDKLGMLAGAQKEARQVIRKVQGTLLLDENASEEQFKKDAPNYRVLHLAMHTLVNNENPLYSKLVFTPNADHIEDGLLNTYELNNMNLNADLVVLSACNTGFGKLNKGEGIIGLTRGFLQAGCKSLLATLWSVADKASVPLINDFYDGLRSNKSKSLSLSAAKRNYLSLNTGMNAHPFFWAGYISIGNDEPINLENNNLWLWIFLSIGVILILAFLGLIFFKRKSRKESGFQSN